MLRYAKSRRSESVSGKVEQIAVQTLWCSAVVELHGQHHRIIGRCHYLAVALARRPTKDKRIASVGDDALA